MRMKILMLLLLSLVAIGEEWMTFTEDDGLASNICRCVAVDHDGVVWVGHGDPFSGMGGVSSWDGEVWTTYYSWTTGSALRSNIINDIEVDDDNNKWFATGTIGFDGGLTKFDGENWSSYNLDTLVGRYIPWVNEIVFDNNGVLWAATNYGLVSFEEGTWTVYDTSDGLRSDIVYCLSYSQYRGLWIGSRELFLFNGHTVDERYSTSDGLLFNNVSDIAAAYNCLACAHFYKGVTVFDYFDFTSFDTTVFHSTTFPSVEILSSDEIILSTGAGIFINRTPPYSSFERFYPSIGYTSEICWDIYEDLHNNIYLSQNEGLVVFSEDSIIWSIEEKNEVEQEITVSPNPFNNRCNILSDVLLEIEIFDLSGKKQFHSMGRQITWDPENLPSGIYLAKFKQNNENIVKKITYIK